MKKNTILNCFAGIAGNILENYDSTLFGLVVPFTAPLFFDDSDQLIAMTKMFAMMILGVISRPLGSLFFGWIGDTYGRIPALFLSLMGMAIVTIGIGCLPTIQEVGNIAPLFLGIGIILQNFCIAGEISGGAIFVLENTAEAKRSLLSGFFDASAILGIFFASCLVTIFSYFGYMEKGWRILFWIGGATAILGVFLRLKAYDGNEFVRVEKASRKNILQVLKEHRRTLFSIVGAVGFSYTTYALAFNLMNGLVPLATPLTKTHVMQVNTALLLVDMLLLPAFGYLASKVGKEKVMLAGSLSAVILAIPLFLLLGNGTLLSMIVIRFAIVIIGVSFAASYHAWALEQVTPAHRFLILSFGWAIGSRLIGAPTSAVCLWLYQKLGWVGAPGIYFMAVACLASYMVWRSMKQRDAVTQVGAIP